MVALRKYAEEAIGWGGALFSLSAFGLNSLNVISSQSVEYLVMNIIASIFLIIYALSKKAHASWVLNSIWLLMTAVALAKSYMSL